MKKLWKTIILFGVLLCLTGCGKEAEESVASGRLYYLDSSELQLVSEGYEPKADFKEALVKEYVEALQLEPENRDYQRLHPEAVKILDYSFGEAEQLILNLDASYSTLTGITEILVRAALVKTFCQIDGVDYVEFYINGLPYMAGDVPVGMMKASDFIDGTASQDNYSQYAYVALYFANETGDALIETHRYVGYNSDISMEQLVIEQLLAGPTEEEAVQGMIATLPEGTQLVKASTKDGICYVDLNDKFLNKQEGVNEAVVLYSVVNSLAELSNINKVQFWINGETKKLYHTIEFSGMFERNLDIIVTEN